MLMWKTSVLFKPKRLQKIHFLYLIRWSLGIVGYLKSLNTYTLQIPNFSFKEIGKPILNVYTIFFVVSDLII